MGKGSASEMTYIVSGGAVNSAHSLYGNGKMRREEAKKEGRKEGGRGPTSMGRGRGGIGEMRKEKGERSRRGGRRE